MIELRKVDSPTPTEKGEFSFVGPGLALCCPFCGNTAYHEGLEITSRSPLSVAKVSCAGCGEEFSIDAGSVKSEEAPAQKSFSKKSSTPVTDTD